MEESEWALESPGDVARGCDTKKIRAVQEASSVTMLGFLRSKTREAGGTGMRENVV